MGRSVLDHMETLFLQKGMMTESLVSPNSAALKVHKVGSRNWQRGSFLQFSPDKFSILYLASTDSLVIDTYFYNEQLVETRREDLNTWFDTGLEGACGAIDYVIAALNTQNKLCQGVQIDRMLVPDVHKILVESYNNKIIYRSRDCQRLIASQNCKPDELKSKSNSLLRDLCYECTCLLQPVLKLEDEDIYSQGDPLLLQRDDLLEVGSDPVDEDDIADFLDQENLPVQNRKRRRLNNDLLTDEGAKETGKQLAAVFVSCQQCGQQFDKRKRLQEHLAAVHPDSVRCPVADCTTVFNEYLGRKMRNHLVKEHADAENLEIGCVYCNTTLSSVKSLQVHQKDCAEVFTCDTCTKTYTSLKYFRMHKCKGGVHQTPICLEPGCGKLFKSKSSLKDHMNSVHTEEKQYVCSGCGKAYRNRQKRRTCENNHMGKFLHPCSLCDKKFNCRRRIQQHMRTHTGEKPFVCPVCSYRCSRMDNLNIHTKKSHDMTVAEAELKTGISAKLDKQEGREAVTAVTADLAGQVFNAANATVVSGIGAIGVGGQQLQSSLTASAILSAADGGANVAHMLRGITDVGPPTIDLSHVVVEGSGGSGTVSLPASAVLPAVNSSTSTVATVIGVAQAFADDATGLPSLSGIASETGLAALEGSLGAQDITVGTQDITVGGQDITVGGQDITVSINFLSTQQGLHIHKLQGEDLV